MPEQLATSNAPEDPQEGQTDLRPVLLTPETVSNENSPESRPTCGALKRNGKPCGFREWLCETTGHCKTHCQCSKHLTYRKDRATKGGKQKAVNDRARKGWPLDHSIDSETDIKVVIEWAMRSLDVKSAAAIRGLCDTWMKAHAQADLARELRELRVLADRFKSSQHS